MLEFVLLAFFGPMGSLVPADQVMLEYQTTGRSSAASSLVPADQVMLE